MNRLSVLLFRLATNLAALHALGMRKLTINVVTLLAHLHLLTWLGNSADLKLLWQTRADTGDDGFLSLAATGGDGSVVVKSFGKYAGNYLWLSSIGKPLSVVGTNALLTILAISDKALVTAENGSAISTTNRVAYFENRDGVVIRKDWAIAGELLPFLGTLNGVYAGGERFAFQPVNVGGIPRFYWLTSTNMLSCYSLEGSAFTGDTNLNRLSNPSLSRAGLEVAAETYEANSFTIERSRNLKVWEQVITLDLPRPSQSFIIPIGGDEKLFLRLMVK